MSMILVNKFGRRTITCLKTIAKGFTVIDVDVLDSILVIKDFVPNSTAKAVDDGWSFVILELNRKFGYYFVIP